MPRDWKVGDRTGTGDWGRAHDIAVLWPPREAPMVIAVLTEHPDRDAPDADALVAEATRRTLAALVRRARSAQADHQETELGVGRGGGGGGRSRLPLIRAAAVVAGGRGR